MGGWKRKRERARRHRRVTASVEHIIARARERYDLILAPGDVQSLTARIEAGEGERISTAVGALVRLPLLGRIVVVLTRGGIIKTFLPPTAFENTGDASRHEERDELREVIEQASAEVAMWPEWKRNLTLASGGDLVDVRDDPDRYVNIPRTLKAIDAEIERLKTRRAELAARLK